MAYLTYRADVTRAAMVLKNPAKAWAKSLPKLVHDPFKLFPPTFKLVAKVTWAGAQVSFFTVRRIVDK